MRRPEGLHRAAAACVGAALVLAGTTAVVALTSSPREGRTAAQPVSSDTTRSAPSLRPVPGPDAPVPPQDGAWIGAWVKPDVPTPGGRLAAVAQFEALLGRPLDVAHIYRRWDDPFPREDDAEHARAGKTVLLSWAGTDTRQIQSGLYDELIRSRARDLRRWGVPVLLEWRWEMDRPNLQAEVWGPSDYIAAWKHIRAIFMQEKVTNVGWVWCPLANGFALGRAQPFYPGDDQVDWLCADVYPGPTNLSFAAAAHPFLEWARTRPHPIIIGEFGVPVELGDAVRREWLAAAGAFVKTQPQIKALVYFDSDSSDSSTDPYDTSLRRSPEALAGLKEVARDPYFRVPRS